MKNLPKKSIICEQAQRTMALYMENDPDLTEQRRRVFEKHLENCPKCAKEYQETKYIIDMVKQHWQVSEDTLELIAEAGQSYKPKMTVEEGWADLCRRCPDLAETTEKPKSLQLFLRIGAVAACFVIGVLTWMVFSNYSKQQTFPQDTSSQQVASTPKASVKVELVTNAGNIPISSNQQITSASQIKTLLINGKHQMTMNTNTILTFEPLVKNSNIGCLVKLDSGRIYTNVEHDGNPFIIDTAHGQAVITGTTFDIKTTENSTTLIVTEGTVQFESQEGVVNVTAGQTSEIVGQSTPSIPLSCNTVELTAWATGYKPGPALTQAESNTDLSELPLFFGKEPIVLEETDYGSWVEQKRDWFQQEFPWIFQLKEALTKESIEVDYPELLIKSGDAWQFVCLEGVPARFLVIDSNSLLNTASDYGFDKQWLLGNVPAAKSALEKPVLSENSFTGLNAFGRWLKYLDESKSLEPLTPIYSYHASKYLAETRSLIWFAVRDGRYDLTDEERVEVLALLQEEITAACKCQNEMLYPEDKQKVSCCEDKCQKPINSVVGYIKTMKAVEEQIAKYEVYKCEKEIPVNENLY